MNRAVFLFVILFVSVFFQGHRVFAYSEHESVIPSTYTALPTPNTHEISKGILRGGSPRDITDLQALRTHGIAKILIFKKENKTEVQDEIRDAISVGFAPEQIQHIPLNWVGLKAFRPACLMVKEGLLALQAASQNQQKLFFHCSVGEDRTGVLSALWLKWLHPESSKADLFKNEMCPYGYAEANPKKIPETVKKIHGSMTRLYGAMFDRIADLQLQGKGLEDLPCEDLLFFTLPDTSEFTCRK